VLRLFLVLALVAHAAPAFADCSADRDRLACPEQGLELVVPPDWELTTQTAYPGIVASAVHKAGTGQLTVAAQQVAPDMTAKAFAEKNRATLRKVDFFVGEITAHASGAWLLDSETRDRKRRVRQAYLVNGEVGIVVTLAAPVRAWRTYLRAFDDTLRSVITTPPPPPESAKPEASP
jgi:hypothetical protein